MSEETVHDLASWQRRAEQAERERDTARAALADTAARCAELSALATNAGQAHSHIARVASELRDRLDAAEADAAALRSAATHALRALDLAHDEERLREHLTATLAAAGRTLLAELEAARAVVRAARQLTIGGNHPIVLQGATALRAALADYDQAQRGALA